jgi:4-hydroxy-tetrahydrodipicolinate synthase
VAPYYNRPNQRMLEAHYTAIAEQGGLPVVVYNVPSRTASNVEAATLLRLAAHPNIIGVKEAGGSLDQFAVVLRERPRDFAVLSGDDLWTLPTLALGGDGVVSVASNEIPAEMVALCRAAFDGTWDVARAIHERFVPLFRANFAGAPNPVPVKAAMAILGLLEENLRQPMLPLDEASRAALADVLREVGLSAERVAVTA